MIKQKTCSFFVSTNHLFTIILPYINEKINEGKKVKILSQKDLTVDVKKYLNSVNEFDKDNLLKLSWKGKEQNKKIDKNTVLFVIGEKEFVENIEDKSDILEIVKCYEIENIEIIKNVTEEFEFYLRTGGKVKILKNSQKGQNSNTVTSQL